MQTNYRLALDAQWRRPGLKMDWLGLEDFLRSVLSDPGLEDSERVALCREALGAFTKRGM
jgi:hypothetical protein